MNRSTPIVNVHIPLAGLAKRPLVSLFTGAGGLDLGFEAAGFETRVAVEFDPDAIATLTLNRDWPQIAADIHSEEASSDNICATASLREGDADILIGGPPCQPFSKSGFWVSGDAPRLSDPRASTLGEYLRVLADLLPRTFLLENVPGIAFSNKDEGLVLVSREVERINREKKTDYTLQAGLLRAIDFGVPQDRERVFLIGSREGTQFRFPVPTHTASQNYVQLPLPSSPGILTHRVANSWDAIGDLQDDDDPELLVTGKWAALLPSIPEGNNYLHHTARGEGVPIFGWRRRYWNFLLKLAKAQPSWTIAAQPGPAIGPFHWKNRRLSARELCRLQTIPDSFEVVGSMRAVQKQVGNAVPSALAEKLALEIRRQLLGDSEIPEGCVASLATAPRDGTLPEPEPISRVPRKYHPLIGDHSEHPGTGKGFGAARR